MKIIKFLLIFFAIFKFCTQRNNFIFVDMNYTFYENFKIFCYTFICENFTVKFETLLKTSAIFYFDFPLIHIEAMNDKKRKKFLSSRP